VKIGPDFIQNRAEPAALSVIFVNLAIPRCIISLAEKGDQLGEFLGRKPINRLLDFSQTHVAKFNPPSRFQQFFESEKSVAS
jgi:hypothetical protein